MHIRSRLLPWGLTAFLLTSLVSLFAASAEAGENRWTPIGIGEGLVLSLAADPTAPGVVYAAAGLAGIYRSTDAAHTWQWRGAVTTNLDLWTDVVVAPHDPQRLYATTQPTQVASGGVYTSGDGGAHWQELFRRRVGFNAVDVSPNGTVLVAGQDGEVHRSVDGGQTWTLVLHPESASSQELALAFDPLAPATAYAGASNGLWRSTDSGATWTKIGTWPDGTPVDNVTALAFPGHQPGFLYALMRGRLYRSEDGGLTWTGGAQIPGLPTDLAVDPADPQTVYVTGLNLFVSHDGGATATQLPSPYPGFFNGAAAISPAAPGTLYVSVVRFGVAVSTDGGEHWILGEQRGLSGNRFAPGNFLAAPSGRLYHQPFGDGVIFRSLDRGATWSPLAPLPDVLFELTEEAGAPDRLWAASNPLMHSTDGGASWSPVRLSTPVSRVASPAPRVVLAGGCGIQRSTNGGRTWTQLLTCDFDDGDVDLIRRLDVLPRWPGAAWADVEARRSGEGTTWKVLLSLDSGRTWRTLAQSTNFATVLRAAGSRGVLYLQRDNSLRRSDDAGATWTPIALPGRILSFAVDSVDPDVLYVSTRQRGVLRSTDGGRTWREVNAGLARLGRLWVFDVMADPKLASTAYAFPVKGGIFHARFGE